MQDAADRHRIPRLPGRGREALVGESVGDRSERHALSSKGPGQADGALLVRYGDIRPIYQLIAVAPVEAAAPDVAALPGFLPTTVPHALHSHPLLQLGNCTHH